MKKLFELLEEHFDGEGFDRPEFMDALRKLSDNEFYAMFAPLKNINRNSAINQEINPVITNRKELKNLLYEFMRDKDKVELDADDVKEFHWWIMHEKLFNTGL